MEMLLILLMCCICFSGAYNYRKQRLFYNNDSKETIGTVIKWSQEERQLPEYKEMWYTLTIKASDDKIHKINTANRKARKYKEGDIVVILVPLADVEDKEYHPVILLEDKKTVTAEIILMVIGIGFSFVAILAIIGAIAEFIHNMK